MALTKQQVISKIEVLEDGQIQVRRDTVVLEDGVELLRKYFRYVLQPGNDVSGEPARIRAVANAIWTPQVISDFLAKRVTTP